MKSRKGHNEEEGEEWSAPFKYSMPVPADQGLRVVQTVESGESKQYITDYLELDVAFWIVDWKHLRDGSPLRNNADWKGYKDTKSRYVMQVESIDDLRVIITGQSNEYPGFNGVDWTNRNGINPHLRWLMKKDNRTGQDRRRDHPQGRSLGRRAAAASLMWAKLREPRIP